MPRLLPVPVLLLCVALAGCDAPPPSGPRAPALDAGDGSIQWQGRLPCADCDAIDTKLLLRRDGDGRRYTLAEVFQAAGGGARFVEAGKWRQERAMLRLQADNGGHRTYALLPDGRLQPRDRHGRPLSSGAADFLAPVTATTAP